MSYTKTNWENLPSTNTPLNANNLNKIENELSALDNNVSYSMAETRIGTWIDGKPLYRKVYNTNTLSGDNIVVDNGLVQNFNVNIVNTEGNVSFIGFNNIYIRDINSIDTTSNIGNLTFGINNDGTNYLIFIERTNYSPSYIFAGATVILYYTKTTD